MKGWYGDRQAHSLASKGIRTRAKGQTGRLGTHATSHYVKDGILHVIYHGTEVVRMDFNHDILLLDTGGWKTNTTKARMNQASNQYNLGYTVYQKDYQWYVELDSGEVIPFKDNKLVIDMLSESSFSSRGKSKDAERVGRITKRVEDSGYRTGQKVGKRVRKFDDSATERGQKIGKKIDESATKTADYINRFGKKIDKSAEETGKRMKRLFEV